MTALKKHLDPDRTADIVLPPSMGKAVQELKTQQQSLTQEIDEVKTEATVRKVDESTRVFNLRQAQMLAKIKDLEEKKLKTEKHLNAILQNKNIQLHEELKKVTQVLMLETKKIAPLEKELESRMSSITNIKGEMQLLFESSVHDRKKSLELLEGHGRELEKIHGLVQGTAQLLEGEYRQLGLQVERMQSEKLDLQRHIAGLKEEALRLESELRGFSEKADHLRTLERSISAGEARLEELQVTRESLDQLQENVHQLEREKNETESSLQALELDRQQMQKSNGRLELKLRQVEDQITSRKETLAGLDREILDARKRVDDLRTAEFDSLKSHQERLEQLGQLQTELSRLEGLKSGTLQAQEEVQEFYHEKKSFYRREVELLEESFRSKASQLRAEGDKAKLQWESEFKFYCEQREREFKTSLETMDREDLQSIRARKVEFSSQVLEVLRRQLSREGFQSLEQKADEGRKELESLFDGFFGKTTRWKIW